VEQTDQKPGHLKGRIVEGAIIPTTGDHERKTCCTCGVHRWGSNGTAREVGFVRFPFTASIPVNEGKLFRDCQKWTKKESYRRWKYPVLGSVDRIIQKPDRLRVVGGGGSLKSLPVGGLAFAFIAKARAVVRKGEGPYEKARRKSSGVGISCRKPRIARKQGQQGMRWGETAGQAVG